MDEFFAAKLAEKQKAWRQVATLAISSGVSTPGLVSSLAYFDTYRWLGCLTSVLLIAQLNGQVLHKSIRPCLAYIGPSASGVTVRLLWMGMHSPSHTISMSSDDLAILIFQLKGSMCWVCRREKLTANLIQAQRDFFGSHTYERLDKPGWFHTVWSDSNSADSITTSGYNN